MTELIVDKIRKVDNPVQAQRDERVKLIKRMEELTNCTVVVLYHNLRSPNSMLDDTDADMLESVLQVAPPRKPLLLLLNSNGGLPLAVDMDKQNPTGLLHQLDRFDAAHVVEMRKVRELGRDITGKLLSRHMMCGKSADEVDATVKKFSESAEHKAHGRPIWAPEALNSGLQITILKQNTNLWNASYELLARYDHICQLYGMMRQEDTTKLLETSHTSHRSSLPIEEDS